MNGSCNKGDRWKTRRRLLPALLLLALVTALLVHGGAGQQAAVRPAGPARETYDVPPRRQFRGAAAPAIVRLPSVKPLAEAPVSTAGPTAPIRPVAAWNEITPRWEVAGAVPDTGFAPSGPAGQPGPHSADRIVRLPPVLEALGKAITPALAPPGPQPEDVAPGHKIPFSALPPASEFDLTHRDGRISLVARDTPLSEILSSIAQGQRLNVVCAEDIAARISITLHEVALQDALTAILSTAGYTWTERNDIIQITSVSETNNLSPETQGRITEVFPLDYIAASDVDEVVKGLLSPAGKSFPIQASPNDLRKTKEAVVVEDLPGYVERIRQYIWQADQPPRQVLIEAHILEVVLESNQKCGVNFEYLFTLAGNPITLSTTGFANAAAPQAFLATLGSSKLDALVEAIKTTTDAKTLASPKVLAVNGQEARIQIGEQLGFRVITTTETSTMESVEFLDTGVVLTVTPHISRDNKVLMQVMPQVSSGSVNPDTGLPEEETTEVQTNILLGDGQGILIGGLIQELDTETQNKVTYLGDLWLIGGLFRRHQVIKERSEIIISLVARVLPYEPCYQEHDRFRTERSWLPLIHGALESCPRPWEPSLPDAYHNPKTLGDCKFRLKPPADDYNTFDPAWMGK